MIAGGVRKLRQLIADPTLRRWFIGRTLGRHKNPDPFTSHVPPYARHLLPLESEAPNPPTSFSILKSETPSQPLQLRLPGEDITVSPAHIDALFDRSFDDIETELAVHRFQWVCAEGQDIDPHWVAAVWSAWCNRFANPDDGWAWHPYTAAERAVNILRFARQFGLPGAEAAKLDTLAAHGPAIASKLEYFGEHYTSNHLANNGRGLFILGLELGLPKCTALGAEIMIQEAARSFSSSGLLREDSTHYQALFFSHYDECAELATHHNFEHALVLRGIADQAEKALAYLMLPGGLPLVGDISPDLEPQKLLSRLKINPHQANDLSADGWLRIQSDDWSGLWHCNPEGWSHMPGHGHQDCGSFELHFREERLFVDPGRGAYGEQGEAAQYRSADVHNNLCINDADPYPANKPYYSAAFRAAERGPAPTLERTNDGVSVTHSGYARFKNTGSVQRQWKFRADGFRIEDAVDGHQEHYVRRALVTPLTCRLEGDVVTIEGDIGAYRVHADMPPLLKPIKIWNAYGAFDEGTQIVFASDVTLPWRGQIDVEVIA